MDVCRKGAVEVVVLGRGEGCARRVYLGGSLVGGIREVGEDCQRAGVDNEVVKCYEGGSQKCNSEGSDTVSLIIGATYHTEGGKAAEFVDGGRRRTFQVLGGSGARCRNRSLCWGMVRCGFSFGNGWDGTLT
jgi:hypothetical protein